MNVSDKGQYIFATHCAACHTVGHGVKIGPDLQGVTNTRDRAWLLHFIQKPDQICWRRRIRWPQNFFINTKRYKCPTCGWARRIRNLLYGIWKRHPWQQRIRRRQPGTLSVTAKGVKVLEEQANALRHRPGIG